MKYLLIIVTMISPVTLMSNLFKRQSLDATDLTSTVTQPPLPCPTVDNGSGCYPLSQCSGASTQSSNEGVYFQICGEDSVTKEQHVCCNKMSDTTTTPSSTTTITPTSTTTPTPTPTTTPTSTTTVTTPTTPETPFECAKIKTSGFGVITRRNKVQATAKPFIVGGNATGKDVYPYMAALFYEDAMNKAKPLCGASIISRRSLLTAAHCFPYLNFNPYDKFVAVVGDYILGNSSDESNPIEVEVDRIILHPDYNMAYVYNDIAIVVLKTALNFSESVTPVCLPSKDQVNETYAGLDAVVTGWGQDKYRGRFQPTLQSAVITVNTQQECQNIYSGLNKDDKQSIPDGITIDIICAGLYNNITRRDSCEGDSGGPLVASDQYGLHWIQIGIVASGYKCADVYPGLYTRITQYLDWIATNRVP